MSIDIICTIGPASSDPAVLKQLLEQGMTVARINLSHGTHEGHRKVIADLRELSSRLSLPIRILGDLQGPKIRLGEIEGGSAVLAEGSRFTLGTEPIVGGVERASVDYPSIVQDARIGSRILINDGEVELSVTGLAGNTLETLVTVGGTIASRKSVNLPGTPLHLPAITDKDKADILFLIEEQVDMIACSFIRSAEHIAEIRAFSGITPEHRIKLIAKIETTEGVLHFNTISSACDGIMVARGDLGVELPYYHIPVIQKAMINECRRTGTYVITATQMLQSMVEVPVPTRAEVTDIFQAVLDGTNAVMLSAESAAGKYPLQSTSTLKTVSHFAEQVAAEAPYDMADLLALMAGTLAH